jgi:hypothetical protein
MKRQLFSTKGILKGIVAQAFGATIRFIRWL